MRFGKGRSHGVSERSRSTFLTKLLAAGAALVAIGAIGASPAMAGNFLATGHDVDDHSYGGGQEHFLRVATDFARSGAPNSSAPVLVIECNTLTSGAIETEYGAGVVPHQSNCPSADPAAFNALALTTANFSAIIVGSSCDAINRTDCSTQTEDSDLLTARSTDIAAFFNAGGGIFAMSGQINGDGDPNTGPDNYYSFVPIGIQGQEVNPPFCLTPEGIALGFHDQSCPDPNLHAGTFDDINCCPTHNSFSEPPAGSALKVAERDSLNFPETLFAQGQILGGGFVPPSQPDPYREEACGFEITGKAQVGTAAGETITGTAQSDHLQGADGNDIIVGLDGADCLFGNRDRDTIGGGSGDDVIRGGRNRDLIAGRAGDDDIRLQDGADKGKGGAGDDFIKAQGKRRGAGGIDRVKCGAGDDRATVDRWDDVAKNCEKVKVVN